MVQVILAKDEIPADTCGTDIPRLRAASNPCYHILVLPSTFWVVYVSIRMRRPGLISNRDT